MRRVRGHEIRRLQIGLVAERREARDAEAELAREQRHLEREVAALRDEADRPRLEVARAEIEPGRPVVDAHAVGPEEHSAGGADPFDRLPLAAETLLATLAQPRRNRDDRARPDRERRVDLLLERRHGYAEDDQLRGFREIRKRPIRRPAEYLVPCTIDEVDSAPVFSTHGAAREPLSPFCGIVRRADDRDGARLEERTQVACRPMWHRGHHHIRENASRRRSTRVMATTKKTTLGPMGAGIGRPTQDTIPSPKSTGDLDRGRIAELAEREQRRLDDRTHESRAFYERARHALSGGVSSAYQVRDPWPIYLSHGKGSRVWDVDGNELVDFHNGFGAMVQGHAHPAIVRAVQARVELGTHFAAPTEDGTIVAENLKQRWGLPRWRFVNSGSEATMDAIRIARAATGRETIVKIFGSYHGHHDYVMVSIGVPYDSIG